MNKTTMTLTNADWTLADMIECWADDETLTAEQQADAADTEAAYIINNLSSSLPTWSYDAKTGTFSGPADSKAEAKIMDLITEAADYVVEHLDEIRTDAA